MMPTVDLIVNTFERNYRKVLSPGFFHAIETQCGREFSRRLVLINNVDNVDEVVRLAESGVESGEICDYFWVADFLDKALEKAGLSRKDLGRIPHFSDYAFVAPYLAKSNFLLYWDADVHLTECCDWITPGAELLRTNLNVLVVNPRWHQGGLEQEMRFSKGDFSFGFGFSDQLFLADPNKLTLAHSSSFCPISLRYPLSHIMPIFEERVDRFMRRAGLLRATYLPGSYYHPVEQGGLYPALNFREQVFRTRNRLITTFLKRVPFKSPMLSI